MNVLITSGGMRIPIDSVRHIGNMSKGTFGAKIASEFTDTLINKEDRLFFLHHKYSILPNLKLGKLSFCSISYDTFEDYKTQLIKLVPKMDVIILAAAVADYGVIPINGKIRSRDDLTIKLFPLPKLISKVRDLNPNAVICGFKLLVNSTENELISAAYKQIIDCNTDICIANDWSTIKGLDHEVHIVEESKSHSYLRKDFNIAQIVKNTCINHYWKKQEKKQNDKNK
jgi:phosphopantothenate-cysteine ligase